MAEFTSYGIVRRNRTEILEDIKQKMRDKLGQNLIFTDDSAAQKIAVMLTEYALENDKLAEEVYENRKINSAEGIYLDDILNRFGFYRQGPTAGTGRIAVSYDNSVLSTTEFSPSQSAIGENGGVYKPTTTTLLSDSVSGFRILASEINLGQYTASINSLVTGNVEVFNYDLQSNLLSDKLDMVEALRDFILDNTTDNESLVYINPTTADLYIGYSGPDTYVGLTETVQFSMNPFIGIRWSEVDSVASVTGYNPLPAGGLTSFSPAFLGYIEVTNGRAFSPGTETETDAEYYARWRTSGNSYAVGTRDGIVRALLDTENVVRVRIYDNPTLQPMLDVNDELIADPLTFNTVVQGAEDSVVAKTIYDNKPINAATFGNVSIPVDTLDGDIEIINFTRPEEKPVVIRVTYSPRNSSLLTATEQEAVSGEFTTTLEENDIGGVIYNTQLEDSVYDPLAKGRLRSLLVEWKNLGDDDSSYSVDPIIPAFNEVVVVGDGDIVFEGSV